MNFGFTEEQELLRDQVRRFMQEACPMGEVRKLMKSDTTMPRLFAGSPTPVTFNRVS